ncbi:MAG: helix-turn-helix domain-containing protein [Conexivisphaerales archaeon]
MVFEVDPPVEWVRTVLAHDGVVRIRDIKTAHGDEVSDFVELSTKKNDAELLVKHLKESVEWSDLKKVGKDTVIGTVRTHGCPLCSVFEGLNCFLVSARTTSSGTMEWHFFASEPDQLKELYSRLDRRGIRYRIVKVSNKLGKVDMTARQEEILRLAYQLGFYEFPKRITLKGLSERLGVAPGTLSEILRRAQKNLLSKYISDDSFSSEHRQT